MSVLKNYNSRIIGNGKPFIFLPAAGFTGMEGLNIAESLQDQYECHLLDLPGFGQSKGIQDRITEIKLANWVKTYIDSNNWEKVTLLGHSMGGGLAMCFASHYPQYVDKLILLDQGHKKLPTFPTKDFGVFGYAIPLIKLLESMFGNRFIRALHKLFQPSEESESKIDIDKQVEEFCTRFQINRSPYIEKAIEDMKNVHFSKEALRLLIGYSRINLPKVLENISVSSLLIYASFKEIDRKEALITEKSIKKLNPPSSVKLHEAHSHHYIHWTNEEILAIIRHYLEVPNSNLMK